MKLCWGISKGSAKYKWVVMVFDQLLLLLGRPFHEVAGKHMFYCWFLHYKPNLWDAPAVINTIILNICHRGATL